MKLSTMVERSTTFIRLFDVSLLSQRPADKLLGGAVTLGFAVLMGRLYLRCLQNMDDQRSWASLLQNFLQFLNGDQTIENKGGFLHRGCCHCGAIEFEVRGEICYSVFHISYLVCSKLQAGRIIRARRGGGKINYAHLRTLATNIRVTRGAHQLRIYYVATSLCPNEEALDLGAFMFCTTCGVHLLHAENANSALLDVNVHCLDNQASIELTSHKHDLSIGKKAAQKNHATPECDFEGDFSHFVQNHDWSNQQLTVPGPIEPLQNKLASPSTPSTQYSGESAATGGGMDHDSASSGPGEPEGLRNGTGGDLLLVDTIYPQRQEGGRASTTPMMRDQLKHYMKKHLKSTKSEA